MILISYFPFLFLFTLSIQFWMIPHTFANELSLGLPYVKKITQKIQSLTWNLNTSRILETKTEVILILEGDYRLSMDGWILLDPSNQEIPVSKNNLFKIQIPIKPNLKSFSFSAVGPFGEFQTESLHIGFLPTQEKRMTVIPDKAPPFQKIITFETELFRYQEFQQFADQQQTTNSSSILLGLKGNISSPKRPELWVFNGTFSAHIFTLKRLDSATYRTFYFSMGVLRNVLPTWKLTQLQIGFAGFYKTMIVEQTLFGFQNLIGPSILIQLHSPHSTLPFELLVSFGLVQKKFGLRGPGNFEGKLEFRIAPFEKPWILSTQITYFRLIAPELQEFHIIMPTFNIGAGFMF